MFTYEPSTGTYTLPAEHAVCLSGGGAANLAPFSAVCALLGAHLDEINLEDNVGNPLAPMLYSFSVLHCMTVSLAHGGAGLGTMWGEQLARRMLAEAGLEVVSVSDVPDDPIDCVYLCRATR
ncbi:hypothetical protein [Saccharothrix deserti]|uniref:hypothetical protein n=1 Tax=Saccharothrix deserti TaxID=2593674 RepID=UPI001EE3A752|nr:hypothetical protein [Saccharothrix deserti]